MRSLEEGLVRYAQQKFCSFHTPGHKGKEEFYHDWDFQAYDLTELPGLDMLHSPQGIIAQAQKRAAEIFGAEESYYLINGATAGNQAMLMSLDPALKRQILVGRAAHRSVMSGLVLSGLEPRYVPVIIHPDFNLPLGTDIAEIKQYWSGAAACHLTYPTYYGTTLDLGGLLADENNAIPPVLVDQAHGAHYLSPLFPDSALKLGADLVLHSMHKTLSALTQTGILHVQGPKIRRNRLRQSLELLQSSSPSYLFMASLERASEQALVSAPWADLREEVELLHIRLGQRLRLLCPQDAGTYGIHGVDWSKILVNTRQAGLDAPEAVRHLREKFGIEPELWDEENILFLLGMGSTPEDVRLLTKGLESLTVLQQDRQVRTREWNELPDIPPMRMSPRAAFYAGKRQVKLEDSRGCIIGETISPYPPGIPLVIAGEEMTGNVLEALLRGREMRWQGWDGLESGLIWIIEEG